MLQRELITCVFEGIFCGLIGAVNREIIRPRRKSVFRVIKGFERVVLNDCREAVVQLQSHAVGILRVSRSIVVNADNIPHQIGAVFLAGKLVANGKEFRREPRADNFLYTPPKILALWRLRAD